LESAAVIEVPPQYVPILQAAAARSGVPYNVLAAKIRQESGFRPDARGAAGEIGIAQVMPATAARPGYGLSPIELSALSDPAQAIPWGAQYLAARARAAGVRDWTRPDQVARGLAAYNGAGPAARAYGRQVAQMAGMVVPPEPVQTDSGDSPVPDQQWTRAWGGPQSQVAEAPMMTEDQRATGEVLRMLRALGAY
jgi:soluble lytic murein transglycosylase-like protein